MSKRNSARNMVPAAEQANVEQADHASVVVIERAPIGATVEQREALADQAREAEQAGHVVVLASDPVDVEQDDTDQTDTEPIIDPVLQAELRALAADYAAEAAADVEHQDDTEHGPLFGPSDADVAAATLLANYRHALETAAMGSNVDSGAAAPDNMVAAQKRALLAIGTEHTGRSAAAVTARKLARLAAHERARGDLASAARTARDADLLFGLDIACSPVAGWLDEPEQAPVATVDHAAALSTAFAALDVAARLLVAASDPADVERALTMAIDHAAADRLALRLFDVSAGGAAKRSTSATSSTSSTGVTPPRAAGRDLVTAVREAIDAHGVASPDGRRGVTVADAKRLIGSTGGALDNQHGRTGATMADKQAAAGWAPATFGGARWFVLS